MTTKPMIIRDKKLAETLLKEMRRKGAISTRTVDRSVSFPRSVSNIRPKPQTEAQLRASHKRVILNELNEMTMSQLFRARQAIAKIRLGK